jgi:23S rRNA pseudouridine2605 synthase
MKERLQKILSAAGVSSRRTAEKMILEGRISVNGEVLRELGSKADPEQDDIRVDGKLISTEISRVYLMLNKPRGYVTTLKDPEGRPIVRDLLRDIEERVFPVGRLDYDSEGLLLLTNDGDFAQRLQHPRFKMPKHYLVKVRGAITARDTAAVEKGVKLEDGIFKPLEFKVESRNPRSTWVYVTIHEGRNRVIRRFFEELGHPVARLIRVGIGEIGLGDLKEGGYRHLKKWEIKKLGQY